MIEQLVEMFGDDCQFVLIGNCIDLGFDIVQFDGVYGCVYVFDWCEDLVCLECGKDVGDVYGQCEKCDDDGEGLVVGNGEGVIEEVDIEYVDVLFVIIVQWFVG